MKYINKYTLTTFIVFSIATLTVISLIYIKNVSIEEKNYLKNGLIREAKSHFNHILITRQWNAKHGGVYVLQQNGLKPNPYLIDNKKLDADGNVMIKINPAWMTREISSLSSVKDGYVYKITSLNPINPINKANEFEIKALKYFEKNKDEKYYYEFGDKLNFVGALKVQESCLKCHSSQGYKTGDIRGGIRVSIPTDIYTDSINSIDQQKFYHSIIVIFGAVVFTLLILYIIKILYVYKSQKDELKDKDTLLLKTQKIANLGFWRLDFSDNTLVMSPELYKTFELDADTFEPSYKSFLNLIHPEDKNIVDEAYKASLKIREPYEITYKVITKSNTLKYISHKCETHFDKNGNPIESIATIQDITELQKIYDEMRKKDEVMIAQSRHAAMGEMISMIAHQWRQPISVISMDANNIVADIELEILEEENLYKYAQNIIEHTQDLSQTIDKFSDFFKPSQSPTSVLLSDIISDSLNFIQNYLQNSDIEIEINIEENLSLTTYAQELIQVLINLLKNAQESLDEIDTQNKKIVISASKKDSIIINICDNGDGIDKQNLEKIFHPYFTTKDEHNGAGLGLYVTKTIVQKHLKGKIEVKNKDKGVCFSIHLPLDFT